MKSIRIKIKGLGFQDQPVSLTRTIEVPTFTACQEEGSVLEQQRRYVEDNYDEFVFLYVRRVSLKFRELTGFTILKPKAQPAEDKFRQKVERVLKHLPKEQQVVALFELGAEEKETQELFQRHEQKLRDDYEAIMNQMWPVVKHLPAWDIFNILMKTMTVGQRVSINTMQRMRLGNGWMNKISLFKENFGLDAEDQKLLRRHRPELASFIQPALPPASDETPDPLGESH